MALGIATPRQRAAFTALPGSRGCAAYRGTVPDLSPQRRKLVLAICCMSLFIVGLDVTIVNVALPTISTDFHAQLTDLQWIMDAYTLVLAAFLILAGSTADRLGRRRIFRTGLLLFTLGSLMCSLAPSLGWLIAARVVQALGGTMLNPVAHVHHHERVHRLGSGPERSASGAP